MLWSGAPLLALAGGLRPSAPRGAVSFSRGSAAAGGRGARVACAAGTGGAHCASTILQRNAVSLVHAAAQSHTIAYTWTGYAHFASSVARAPSRHAMLIRRARGARRHAPLFDVAGWARGFDAGMHAAWEVRAAGRAAHVVVARGGQIYGSSS